MDSNCACAKTTPDGASVLTQERWFNSVTERSCSTPISKMELHRSVICFRGLQSTWMELNIQDWGLGFTSPNPLGQPLLPHFRSVWTTCSSSVPSLFILYRVHTIPCSHYTMFTLYRVHTIPFSHYTVFTLYCVHTIPCSYYTVFIPYRVHTIPCSYYTVFILYRVYTIPWSHYIVFSPYRVHTIPCWHEKLSGKVWA